MEERQKEREKRANELKSNLKMRKQTAKKMQKKTHRGQPLMKYQIPNLLEKISKSLGKE